MILSLIHISAGAEQLKENSSVLKNGVSALNSGAKTLSEGAVTLADGMKTFDADVYKRQIEKIGKSAFAQNKNLTTVSIPNSVTEIE